jgi:hypothetical protein
MGIFWVRIPESILGSCHSSPQMERYGVNEHKNDKPPEEKITSGRKKVTAHDEV